MPTYINTQIKFICTSYFPRSFGAKATLVNVLLPGNYIDIGGYQYRIQEAKTGHQELLLITPNPTSEDFVYAEVCEIVGLCTIVLIVKDMGHVREFQELLLKHCTD